MSDRLGRGRPAIGALVRALDRWLAVCRRTARLLALAGGVLILAAAGLVAVEVTVRGFFRLSLGGADELSGYAVAIATSFGLAFTLLERGHVRVDALCSRLPARAAALLDLLALVALTGFLALLGQRAGLVLGDTLAFDTRATTPLATPLWIPQALWLAGFALHLLVAVPLALRAALALLAGDLETVRGLAGAPGLDEVAASEGRPAP